MDKLIGMIIVALLSLSGTAVVEPFDDGIAAYERGDYATPLRLWRPLVGQDPRAAAAAMGPKAGPEQFRLAWVGSLVPRQALNYHSMVLLQELLPVVLLQELLPVGLLQELLPVEEQGQSGGTCR